MRGGRAPRARKRAFGPRWARSGTRTTTRCARASSPLRHARVRAAGAKAVPEPGGGEDGRVRLHRGLVQPAPEALDPRSAVSPLLRKETRLCRLSLKPETVHGKGATPFRQPRHAQGAKQGLPSAFTLGDLETDLRNERVVQNRLLLRSARLRWLRANPSLLPMWPRRRSDHRSAGRQA